jgi:phosphatidate cytidylyltransferase
VNNFWTRAITGTVFVIVMVGCIYFNYWSLTGLFFLISILGLNEFYGLLDKAGYKPNRVIGLFVGALTYAMFAFHYSFALYDEYVIPMIFPFIVLIFFAELYRKQEKPFVNIALTITGILYTVMPFALWVNFSCPFIAKSHNDLIDALTGFVQPQYSPHILLGFFFMLWTNDTGAYIVGRLLGKRKLWERISPKKTWEGFIGGVILSIAIGYVISIYYTDLTPTVWMLMGFTIGVFGTLGDLTESMFKRSIDVKESGGILPGHGGILDRFDGVFLSTPFVIALVQIMQFIPTVLHS